MISHSCLLFILLFIILPLQQPSSHYTMGQSFHVQAFIFVVILMVYVLTSHVIENKRVPYVHESSIAILMGIVTAIISKYTMDKQIDFSNDLFFTIILPPMIFSAGYSLRKSLFFQNFGIISFLGIIGTVIGFIILTFYLTLLNNIFFQTLTLSEILMLASVLCATDTVAAMSLIKAEKYPILNAVLFGESIINDAVAIILFGTVSKLQLDQTGAQFTSKVVIQMFLNFCYLFFFSVGFGTLSGLCLSYLFKTYQSINKYPIKQTSLILLNGYFTYLMGELLGLSGIISLFTCAIIMGHYSFMNISEESQNGTGLAFQTVSYIAEAFVFTYLGASSFSIDGELLAVAMAILILLSFPFIRAIMVFIMPLCYKIVDKQFILSSKQLKICWYSGMIRGVIAFALCLQIESIHKKFIITVALVTVMITTLCGSSFMKTFANLIGLDDVQQQLTKQGMQDISCMPTHKNIGDSVVSPSKYKSIEGEEKEDQHLMSASKEHGKFQHFQHKYLKPIFTKEKEDTDSMEMKSTLSKEEVGRTKNGTDRKIDVQANNEG